jgi:hypothetical protein
LLLVEVAVVADGVVIRLRHGSSASIYVALHGQANGGRALVNRRRRERNHSDPMFRRRVIGVKAWTARKAAKAKVTANHL